MHFDASYTTCLAVFAVGAVAAFVNSIAGGGSTLSLPLMIFLGLPPTVANGTNRLGIFFGNVASVIGLGRGGFFEVRVYRQLFLPIVLGALFGSWSAVKVPDKVFQIMLAIVIVAVVVMSWLPRSILGTPPAEPPAKPGIWAWFGFLAIGVYGSFMQVGVGFFLIFALSRFSGLDLVRVNALKNALALTFITVSTIAFAISGLVQWPLAMLMSAGAFMGGWLGSKFQIRHGEVFIKHAINWSSLAMAAKLAWDWFHG